MLKKMKMFYRTNIEIKNNKMFYRTNIMNKNSLTCLKV